MPPYPQENAADAEAPRIAPLWRRAVALLLDAALWIPPTFAFVYAGSRFPGWAPVLIPAGLLLFPVYQIRFHARYGATIGKAALRIRVVRDDGSPVDLHASLKRSFVDAVLRLSLAMVSVGVLRSLGNPPDAERALRFAEALRASASYQTLSGLESGWVLAGLLACVLGRRRKALHDWIAGTVVVEAPARPRPEERP